MAIAVKNAAGEATTATVNPAFGSATTAGNFIVLSVTADDYLTGIPLGWTASGSPWDGSNPSPSTILGLGSESPASGIFHGSYVLWRISTGETSFSYTIGSATNSSWVISEWSGVAASAYDIVSAQFTNGPAATTYTTPSITPTSGGRLLIAHMGGWSNSANLDGTWSSILNSFTEVNHVGNVTGNKTGVLQASLLVTANGSTAYSSGATYPGGASTLSRSGIVIAFKETAGTSVSVNVTTNLMTASVGTVVVPQEVVFPTTNLATVSVGNVTVPLVYLSRDYAFGDGFGGYVVDIGSRDYALASIYIARSTGGVGVSVATNLATASVGTVSATAIGNISLTAGSHELLTAVGSVGATVVSNISTTAGGQGLAASVGSVTARAGIAVDVVSKQLIASVGSVTASAGAEHADGWDHLLVSPGIVLSSGDQIGTASGISGGLWSVTEHSIGHYYVEVTLGGIVPVGLVGLYGTTALGAALPMTGVFLNEGGDVVTYDNGVLTQTVSDVFPALAQNDVVGIAYNGSVGKVWFRVNGGNWNNSAAQNPGNEQVEPSGQAVAVFTGNPVVTIPKSFTATGLSMTASVGTVNVNTTTTSSWPTATSTGVPSGTVLTDTPGTTYGSGFSGTSGNPTIIQNKRFTGSVYIDGDWIILRNCEIQANPASTGAQINSNYTLQVWGNNCTVENCTIDGMARSTYDIWGYGTFTGNKVIRAVNGITIGASNTIVRGNYINVLTDVPATDPHYDGIELHGGDAGITGGTQHTIIEDNTILSRDTSCIFMADDDNSIRDVRINHNYMGGTPKPGYDIVSGQRVSGRVVDNVVITNNVCEVAFYGSYFSLANTTNVTMTGNTDATTGLPIS